MTEFRTDISENGKKFELVFQTDIKAYFEKMQAMARECIDHKPVTQFDRIRTMSVEKMAQLLCNCSDCGNGRCYGNDLCTQGDGACNGLVKWLEQEVSK